jgi:hypothetical protein
MPPAGSAESARGAPAGTPNPLCAPAHSAPQISSQENNPPRPPQRASRRRPPPRPSPPCLAPATLVCHREAAIAGSAGRRGLRGRRSESAPGTRGRRGASCSRFGSRTSSIASRSPAVDSHPGPGAGWGRGLLSRARPHPGGTGDWNPTLGRAHAG